MKKKNSKDEKIYRTALIVCLLKKGADPNKVAEAAGISRRSIYYYTKRYNITLNCNISPYEVHKEKIKELIDKGCGYRKVARELSIPRNSVRSICRKYDFTNEKIEMHKSGEYGYERGSNYDRNIKRSKRRKEALKNLTVDEDITLRELYKRSNGICAICGQKTDYKDFKKINDKFIAGTNYPSIDHIKPLSKGGLHSWNNIQLAHMICNAIKGTKEKEVRYD